jgi:hypothetical protein
VVLGVILLLVYMCLLHIFIHNKLNKYVSASLKQQLETKRNTRSCFQTCIDKHFRALNQAPTVLLETTKASMSLSALHVRHTQNRQRTGQYKGDESSTYIVGSTPSSSLICLFSITMHFNAVLAAVLTTAAVAVPTSMSAEQVTKRMGKCGQVMDKSSIGPDHLATPIFDIEGNGNCQKLDSSIKVFYFGLFSKKCTLCTFYM